ncbi:hypothetical protein [Kitasatospora sp. NPDC089509]|uniref:hypothetical protein n=1 Tax=Kitasatospora sp. NPDC089509 TaxID=3364079 RepID=UPI00381593B0
MRYNREGDRPGTALDPQVWCRLPLVLRTEFSADSTEAGGCSGPVLSDALYWFHQVQQLNAIAGRIHAGLDELVYRPGTAPSDRRADALRSCGAATAHAAAVLRQAVDEVGSSSTVSRTGPRPWNHAVSGAAWARATCSMRAESAICAELVRCQAPGPLTDSVARLARHAENAFHAMALAPAFAEWRTVMDPLYLAWLDGVLRGLGSPPPLFPHRNAFYDAHPAVAPGDDAGGELLSWADVFPLGSLERYVCDSNGTWWAIIIAAPGGPEDPRDWPSPSAVVVASAVPGHVAPGRCYLLASMVLPRRVLPLIAMNSRLEDIAAVLAAPDTPASGVPPSS